MSFLEVVYPTFIYIISISISLFFGQKPLVAKAFFFQELSSLSKDPIKHPIKKTIKPTPCRVEF